jgi:protein transport protein SEC24
MSAPPSDGYGYAQVPPNQYGEQVDPQLEQPQEDQFSQPAAAAATGKKKKRGYAAQAFDVGTGANAAAGGQQQAGGQYGVPPAVQHAQPYGGYAQPDPQAAALQGYQQPAGQPYGAPPPGVPQQTAYGGYQAPDQGYAAPGAVPTPGVAGITQGLGGMQLGGQPQQQQQPQGLAPRPVALNQLYPTDLLNQPFQVSELDLPPPPIILPPNVSIDLAYDIGEHHQLTFVSL